MTSTSGLNFKARQTLEADAQRRQEHPPQAGRRRQQPHIHLHRAPHRLPHGEAGANGNGTARSSLSRRKDGMCPRGSRVGSQGAGNPGVLRPDSGGAGGPAGDRTKQRLQHPAEAGGRVDAGAGTVGGAERAAGRPCRVGAGGWLLPSLAAGPGGPSCSPLLCACGRCLPSGLSGPRCSLGAILPFHPAVPAASGFPGLCPGAGR